MTPPPTRTTSGSVAGARSVDTTAFRLRERVLLQHRPADLRTCHSAWSDASHTAMRWITPAPGCGPARWAAGALDARRYGRSGRRPPAAPAPARPSTEEPSLPRPSDAPDGPS